MLSSRLTCCDTHCAPAQMCTADEALQTCFICTPSEMCCCHGSLVALTVESLTAAPPAQQSELQ